MKWLVFVVLVGLMMGAMGRKTAKEWNSYVFKQDQEPIPASAKPEIFTATFAPGVDERERLLLGNKWTGQLQSVGIKIGMFGSNDNDDKWIITTSQAELVWKYFKRHIVEMPQLVRIDSEARKATLWNVPTHQSLYEEHEKEL
ncbi:hypothetical protein BASA81_010173 [Batrachochytrium salamandrivorans]|nr:hypothetical protein BASA81_010173 [Batrachochytrium salamandrivorans]